MIHCTPYSSLEPSPETPVPVNREILLSSLKFPESIPQDCPEYPSENSDKESEKKILREIFEDLN